MSARAFGPQETIDVLTPAQSALRRTAWIEVDLERLRSNFRIIRAFAPPQVGILSVVKAEAYGHGAVPVARVALAEGARGLAVATVAEAAELRDAGITAPILLLTPATPEELPYCRDYHLTFCLSQLEGAQELQSFAAPTDWRPAVHLKANTGMNRYGLRWSETEKWLPAMRALSALRFEGVLSHFAMSDELDKSFAQEQTRRFATVLERMSAWGLTPGCRHLCNSGGLLDLPEAHFDMVRIGLLPLGVYPSRVCRRLPGLAPVMTVKARLMAINDIQAQETVGYGLRYQAPGPRRIGIVPLGYADGFPRVRNEGHVLIAGQRAPLVGGVAMNALAVDITEIPEARLRDEVVILGRQGPAEITAEELAQLKRSVSYDVLTAWRHGLPRIYRGS